MLKVQGSTVSAEARCASTGHILAASIPALTERYQTWCFRKGGWASTYVVDAGCVEMFDAGKIDLVASAALIALSSCYEVTVHLLGRAKAI